MTAFPQSTGAMVSPSLNADPQGLWADHIASIDWGTAKQGAKAMVAHPDAKPFTEMIAAAHAQMRHAAISLCLPPE